MTDSLPPGVAAVSEFYIRVEGLLYTPKGMSCWVSRFKDRLGCPAHGWNVDHRFADPFRSLADAKKVMRGLSKRLDLQKAKFTIVELTPTYRAVPVFPLDVLDKLARV